VARGGAHRAGPPRGGSTSTDLDTFVYAASHDLKAPITNIEAILLALQAQLPAEVQQDELVAQLLAMPT